MHSNDHYFNYLKSGKLYIAGSNSTIPGNGAFNKDLENAVLPRYFEDKKVYGTGYRALPQLQNLTFVFIPNTYIEISADSFLFCKKLESVVFEEGSRVETIGFWLLNKANITSFTIPPSVKSVWLNSSFSGCTNLKRLYYQGMIELQSDKMTFNDASSDLKIYVRIDYPYSQIGGRDVIKILPPLTSKDKTRINKNNHHFLRCFYQHDTFN